MNLMVKGADGKEYHGDDGRQDQDHQGAKKLDARALKVGDRVVAAGPEAQGMISAETVKVGAAPRRQRRSSAGRGREEPGMKNE